MFVKRMIIWNIDIYLEIILRSDVFFCFDIFVCVHWKYLYYFGFLLENGIRSGSQLKEADILFVIWWFGLGGGCISGGRVRWWGCDGGRVNSGIHCGKAVGSLRVWQKVREQWRRKWGTSNIRAGFKRPLPGGARLASKAVWRSWNTSWSPRQPNVPMLIKDSIGSPFYSIGQSRSSKFLCSTPWLRFSNYGAGRGGDIRLLKTAAIKVYLHWCARGFIILRFWEMKQDSENHTRADSWQDSKLVDFRTLLNNSISLVLLLRKCIIHPSFRCVPRFSHCIVCLMFRWIVNLANFRLCRRNQMLL